MFSAPTTTVPAFEATPDKNDCVLLETEEEVASAPGAAEFTAAPKAFAEIALPVALIVLASSAFATLAPAIIAVVKAANSTRSQNFIVFR
jgi:hypothetical protein